MTKDEALKPTQVPEQIAKYVAALVQGTHEITSVTIRPKREWVGLTEKASELVYEDVSGQSLRPQDYRLVLRFAVAVEAKLKELNT